MRVARATLWLHMLATLLRYLALRRAGSSAEQAQARILAETVYTVDEWRRLAPPARQEWWR